MATLNFPDSPDTGDIYTDSNSGFTYEWNGTVWISKDPSTASNIREIDNISGSFNGSTTAFTLQVAGVNVEPANVQQLIISVGGVMQNAGDDYTVSGSTLTFTTAPTSGLTFFGTLLGTALSLNTVADGSVGTSSFEQPLTIGDANDSLTIPGNAVVSGILTAANAYVTGILTAQTLNYNNVVDIYSTGIITATRGIQQTGNEGLHVSSGITTVGIFTATKATIGTGVTINNTGLYVTGVTTFSGDVIFDGATADRDVTWDMSANSLNFNDNSAAKFGNSVDLQIYHDGTDNIIKAAGSATPIKIQGHASNASTVHVSARSDKETIKCLNNSNAPYVELYYNNTKRLETASDDAGGGVVVTGKIVGTAATIGTGVTINNTGIDAGNAGIVTAGTFNAPSDTTIKAGDDIILQPADALYLKSNGDNTRLLINSVASFTFDNGAFIEKCKITAGKLSDNQNIDLADGMVHYFSTQESTTATPNLRENASRTIGDAVSTGDIITVTLITTAAAGGYSANLTIDGNAVTEEWVGGAAPSAGSADGLDIYTYTCIRIGGGTGDSGWKVIANLTNATN